MDHLLDEEELPRHERELTLSAGSILGIFLALVVLCGGFFGFGYNMGRKSAPTPLNLSEVATDPSLPATPYGGTKPSPASVSTDTSTSAPAPTPVVTKHEKHTVAPTPTTNTSSLTPSETPKVTTTRSTAPAPIVRQPATVAPAALNPSATPATGSYMVQVAAVSHQEDADLLVGALHARGYTVTARSNGNDKFIHVQVGPFRDKASADAMRQRLIADGYNAIVK